MARTSRIGLNLRQARLNKIGLSVSIGLVGLIALLMLCPTNPRVVAASSIKEFEAASESARVLRVSEAEPSIAISLTSPVVRLDLTPKSPS